MTEPEEARDLRAGRRRDTVATIGDNRKLLVFPLDEVNEMTRGKGVILQRFKDGGARPTCASSRKADGLTWLDAAGPHLHARRARRVDRPARAGRQAGAEGLPEVEQVRPGVRVRASRWVASVFSFTLQDGPGWLEQVVLSR